METVIPMHEGRLLPSISLRQNDLPEISQWDINSKHYIILKVEVTGKHNRKDLVQAPTSDQVKLEANLQIVSVLALTDEPVDAATLKRKEFEELTSQIKSGKRKVQP